jgi:outer membrane beta-barrel protein
MTIKAIKFSLSGVIMLIALALLAPSLSRAEVIQFPDEELASESVLPIFDQPDAVKNRSVRTKSRLELGLGGGYSFTEPFFNPLSVGVNVSYHFTEEHGLNIYYTSNLGGQSDYSKQLNAVPKVGGGTIDMRLQYAPAPKYLALANYQYTGYYGKLSITKEKVMNLGLYGLVGGGMIGIGDSAYPVASVGLGQKFYFDRNFALRFDLRFIAYNGPDPLSKSLETKTSEQANSYFGQKLTFDSVLSFGAVYLFPAF